MAYMPTDDDLLAYEAPKQAPQPQMPQQESGGYMPYVHGFNDVIRGLGLPSLAAGGLQGVADTGISALNLLGDALHSPVRLPHPDLHALLTPADKGVAEPFMFGLGRFAGSTPIPGGIAKALPLASGYLPSALKGAAAGAATLGDEPGERLHGAGIGAGAGLLGEYLGNIVPTAEKAVGRFQETMGRKKEGFSKRYEDILGAHDQPVMVPKANSALLKKGMQSPNYNKLQSFIKNPNLKTAQEAKSGLDKFIRGLKSKYSEGTTTTLKKDAYEEAQRVSNLIERNMLHSYVKNKQMPLAKEYPRLQQDYAKEFAPYSESKAVKALGEGKIRPESFIQKITKDEAFMSQLEHEHPELAAYLKMKRFGKALQKAKSGAVKYGLGLYGLHKVSHGGSE